MTRSRRTLLAVLAVLAVLAGCGGDEETTDAGGGSQGGLAGEAPASTGGAGSTSTPSEPPQATKLHDGKNFNANDIADCLIDAEVGAGVSLDGAAIDLNDALAQVIVEQGNADILVYDDEESAKSHLADYERGFGASSETGQIRNVLWQTDPDVRPEARSAVKICLGV